MKADDLLSMILILGVLPITVIVLLFLLQKAKHKERLELINKGVDLLALNSKKDGPFQDVLLWGILSFSIGLGLLLGYILLEAHLATDDMILGILTILFGGFGLIGYYFIKRRRDKKQL